MRKSFFFVLLTSLITLTLPPSIHSQSITDTTRYSVFMGSRLAGKQLSWSGTEGARMYYYEFNDRGRGPSLIEKVVTDDKGNLKSITVTGNDYTKNPVNEHFEVSGNTASWKNSAGQGKTTYKSQYYYPTDGTIAGKEVLIDMLQKVADHEVNILPKGSVRLSLAEEKIVNGVHLNLVAIAGFSYAPEFYWIDDGGKLFATVSPSRGISCILHGFESYKDELVRMQVEVEDRYYQDIAKRVTMAPWGDVAIKNVNVFNSLTGELENGKTVVWNGRRITHILDNPDPGLNELTKVIDGQGMTLLPGLFDMHVHIDKTDGILHLAAGVTSVRDMAVQSNFIQQKQKLALDFSTGELVGPRIVGMCGFIDGNGPYTRDRGIDSLAQGFDEIWKFHAAGLKQIKLYSSIKPEWVKPLASKAHDLGMKVSGHIPAFMTATQAILAGFDEIQHANMLFLNFYGDTLDTRNMTRFSAVGEMGYTLDFNSEEFNQFADLLKSRDIIIDPTLAIFEWGFCSQLGKPSPGFEQVLDRLPIEDQRRYYSGGFNHPDALHSTYLKSFDKMLELVHSLHERGIRIVPGTDNLAGFTYHRELELYAQSGIPASGVLQIATINAARIAGVDQQLGSIEAGKIADMVLVDGNPLENISDIRNVVLTIKDGRIYDPAKLYPEVGVEVDK